MNSDCTGLQKDNTDLFINNLKETEQGLKFTGSLFKNYISWYREILQWLKKELNWANNPYKKHSSTIKLTYLYPGIYLINIISSERIYSQKLKIK